MNLLLNNLLKLTKFNKPTLFWIIQQRSYCVALNNHEVAQQDTISKQHKEQKEQDQKTLSIAVIGVPNAGKSTFINNLINHRVSTDNFAHAISCIKRRK